MADSECLTESNLSNGLWDKTFRISAIEVDTEMSYFHPRYSGKSLHAIA